MRVWAAIAAVVAFIVALANTSDEARRVVYYDGSSDACRAVEQTIQTCDSDAFGVDIQWVRVQYVNEHLDIRVKTRGLNVFNTNDDSNLFVIGTPDSPWPFGYTVTGAIDEPRPLLSHPIDRFVDCPKLKLTTEITANEYHLSIPRDCLDDADEVQVSVVTDNLVGSPCTTPCTDERFDTWTSRWIDHDWAF
jgi:hypothetical protein